MSKKINGIIIFLLFVLILCPFMFMPLCVDDVLLWDGVENLGGISSLKADIPFLGKHFSVYNFTHPFFYMYVLKPYLLAVHKIKFFPFLYHLPFVLLFLSVLIWYIKNNKLTYWSIILLFGFTPLFLVSTMTSLDMISAVFLIIALVLFQEDKLFLSSIFLTFSWFASYQSLWVFVPLFFFMKKRDFIKICALPIGMFALWMIASWILFGIPHPLASFMWPGSEYIGRYGHRKDMVLSYMYFVGLLIALPIIPVILKRWWQWSFMMVVVSALFFFKHLEIAGILLFLIFIYVWFISSDSFEKFYVIGYSLFLIFLFPVIAVRYFVFLALPLMMPFMRRFDDIPLFNKILTVLMVVGFSLIISFANYNNAYNEMVFGNMVKKGDFFSGEWGFRYYAEKNGGKYALSEDCNEISIIRQNPHIALNDYKWCVVESYPFKYYKFLPIRITDFIRGAGLHSSSYGNLPYTIYRGVSDMFIKLRKYEVPLDVSGEKTVYMYFNKGDMPMFFAHAPSDIKYVFEGEGRFRLFIGLTLTAVGTDGVLCEVKVDTFVDTFNINRGDLIKKDYVLENRLHYLEIRFLNKKTKDYDWCGWKWVKIE